eukprot:1162065-Pelagomonas_calceolata.AAC.7
MRSVQRLHALKLSPVSSFALWVLIGATYSSHPLLEAERVGGVHDPLLLAEHWQTSGLQERTSGSLSQERKGKFAKGFI